MLLYLLLSFKPPFVNTCLVVKHSHNVWCIHNNRVDFHVQISFDKTSNYDKLLFQELEQQGSWKCARYFCGALQNALCMYVASWIACSSSPVVNCVVSARLRNGFVQFFVAYKGCSVKTGLSLRHGAVWSFFCVLYGVTMHLTFAGSVITPENDL